MHSNVLNILQVTRILTVKLIKHKASKIGELAQSKSQQKGRTSRHQMPKNQANMPSVSKSKSTRIWPYSQTTEIQLTAIEAWGSRQRLPHIKHLMTPFIEKMLIIASQDQSPEAGRVECTQQIWWTTKVTVPISHVPYRRWTGSRWEMKVTARGGLTWIKRIWRRSRTPQISVRSTFSCQRVTLLITGVIWSASQQKWRKLQRRMAPSPTGKVSTAEQDQIRLKEVRYKKKVRTINSIFKT